VDAIRLFRRTAARERDRTFAFDATARVTYEEADRRSNSIGAELTDRGISTGAPLALCAPDSVNLLLAILGCWKAGALPALIDARTTAENLPFFLDDIGAKIVAAPVALHDRLRAVGAAELVDIDGLGHDEGGFSPSHGPESPLYLSYTSGTSGLP
jgi:acyl-CoA synthetase (AMP-forming)/AMP-acid ligase II